MPQPVPSYRFGAIIIAALAIPLFLLTGSQQSWMAHDEGLYVSRAMLMLHSGDWVHPWEGPHHKPPGFYWLQAISLRSFGATEFISRLPSSIAAAISMLLVFRIGQILGLAVEGFLAAVFLSTSYLFFFYARLAVPDTLLVAFVLLMVLGLIVRPGADPSKQAWHAFGAGLSIGMMLLFRGPVAFTLVLGMVPYLIATRRLVMRARLAGLATGLFIGGIPVCLWLVATMQSQGFGVINQMMSFATAIATETRHGNGPFYYFWNVGANAFPWSVVAIFGGWRLAHTHDNAKTALLVGFPVVYLLILSLASTHLAHYALPLYPFVAILAAIAVVQYSDRRWPNLILATVLFCVGIVLVIALVLFRVTVSEIVGTQGIIFGGCIAVGFVLGGIWAFMRVPRYVYDSPAVLTALLLSLAFSTAGKLNLVGNVNPAFKAATQSEAAEAALSGTVDFVVMTGKEAVLALIYSSHWGEQVSDAASYQATGPAWIDRDALPQLNWNAKVIAEVGQTLLIIPTP